MKTLGLPSPTVSFLLENHNMSRETIDIIRGLREYADSEIVVIDDGSSHDHTERILDEIDGVNEFLLHFNDLFSTLTINRAVSFARGEYIVKLQDDDIYLGTKWIDEALDLFARHPDLMIIGGRGSLVLPDDWDFSKPLPWRPRAPRFEFVCAVNEAPMWYRRSDFLEIGGLDEEFAPFYWSEQEVCFRAWLAGKTVGWYDSGWKRCATDLTERIDTKRPLQYQSWRKNSAIFDRNFADKMSYINMLVRLENQALVSQEGML